MSAVRGLREARAPADEVEVGRSASPALEIFVWSRLAIWLAAVLAFAWFEPNRHPNAARWDNENLHDLGWLVDIWARWDSTWFLRIAEEARR